MTIFQQNMMKNPHTPNLTWIGSWWPEIWPHEYLMSPIEISVNWPGSKQLWTRPIYTDFNGLIRYSCGHISGSHEPILTKFGLWMFFIMLHRYMVSKTLKCKKKKVVFVTSSLLYSIGRGHRFFFFFFFFVNYIDKGNEENWQNMFIDINLC